MEEQSKQEKRKKIDIERDIMNHFSKIKSLSDAGSSLIDKGGESDADNISKANDLTDNIFQEIETIRELLFELEDLLEEVEDT